MIYIGPVAQLKSMFAPVRATTTIIYIVSMLLTLYCALGLRMVSYNTTGSRDRISISKDSSGRMS
jgi:hypothetical protein